VGKTVCPVCNGTGKNDYWVDPEDTEKAFTMVEMLDPVYVATLEKQEWTCASCDGTGEVDKIERTVKEVPCPKEEALISLLEENEETGRMVVFAAFTGSIDKVTGICLKNGWDVVRVDGRGWLVYTKDGQVNAQPLDYWADMVNNPRVVFVAHPKSGGMGLTLVEARMAVYYSNSFDPESRTQSEDRIHRIGLDINKGATIVDLIHLPTDTRVLEVLKDNRRLELMSMGDVLSLFEEEV
jgi:SNF2 family DNA or RNA helicase